MGYTFLILSAVMIVVSMMDNKNGADPKGINIYAEEDSTGKAETKKSLFYTDPVFNVAAIGICLILIVLYTRFW
jgi:solute:Na+ symporter, SSS family